MLTNLCVKITGLGAACVVACALLGSSATIAATHAVALNPQPLPPGKAIVRCSEYGCL